MLVSGQGSKLKVRSLGKLCDATCVYILSIGGQHKRTTVGLIDLAGIFL